MERIKNIINSLKLRWSDLFLVLWVIPGAFLCFESNHLMDNPNLTSLRCPMWIYILIFVFLVFSYCLYLIFEYKKGYRHSPILLFGLIIILISGFEAIFFNQNAINTIVSGKDGNLIKTITHLTNETKTIHFFSYVYLMIGFYAGLFIFSKRIANKRFILKFCYILYAVAIVFIIISFFKDNYVELFKALALSFSDFSAYSIKAFSIQSVFVNANIYSLFLEFVIAFSIVAFSISKAKLHIIMTVLLYIELLLTVCKTGIILSTIVLLFYFLVQIIFLFKGKDKKSTIKGALYLSTIGLFLLAGILIYCSFESIRDNFNSLFSGGKSIFARYDIWTIGLQIYLNGNIVRGIGYGVYNSILNNLTGFWGSHFWVVSILGRGGLLNLIFYISLLLWTFIKTLIIFKKDYYLGNALLFGLLLLFFHSFFEDSYYIVLVFLFAINIIYNHEKPFSKENESNLF